jgi:PIN domain nuclease of toxin-antitoxin system
MRLLLDTSILLWAAGEPARLSQRFQDLISDTANTPVFSSASLWEIVIKNGLGRDDFQVDAHLLRRGLLDNGYEELAVTGVHVLAVASLPPLHKDPFDRILVAQSTAESIALLTSDDQVAGYPGPVWKM